MYISLIPDNTVTNLLLGHEAVLFPISSCFICDGFESQFFLFFLLSVWGFVGERKRLSNSNGQQQSPILSPVKAPFDKA